MSEKKAKFRDGLSTFCKDLYKIDFSALSSVQRGEGFVLFYVAKILSKKNPGVFPEDIEEIRECITDGAHDQSCDFIYSNDDHHYIIQGKYKAARQQEEEGEVSKFLTVFERLHYEYGRENKKNSKLMDAINEFDYKNHTFSLIFVSLGSATEDIRIAERNGIRDISDCEDLRDISNRTDFQFFDETDLNIEYRDVINGTELRDVELKISKGENNELWYQHKNNDGLTSYITSIKANQVYEIYNRHKSALFNLNIRQHLGDNSTNKEIMKSAEDEPNKFFFYNNGISAVAKKIEASETKGSLICSSFSIINGAQTFRSIHKIYGRLIKTSQTIKDLSVMIRVTEMPNLFKNDGFIDNVTRYNNTQNAVKVSDFRSNDKVQVALAHYFNNISDIDGKTYFYKNKRGRDAPRNRKVISLDDFCRRIFAFLKGPVDCFGGQKHIYDTTETGGYFFLFGDPETRQIIDSLDEKTFNCYSSIYFICETAIEIFKHEKEERMRIERELYGDDEKPLISQSAFKSRYHLYYIVGLFFSEFARLSECKIEELLSKYSFHKPKVWRKKTVLKEKLMTDVVRVACDIWFSEYRKSYETGINHRNWLRTARHLEGIKNELLMSRYRDIRHLFEELKSSSQKSE